MKIAISLPSYIAVISLVGNSQAHTWLENLRLIASNGTFIGDPGFPRGFIGRNAPGFNDNNLINRLNTAFKPDTPMCRISQSTPNQTPGFPALSAAPGNNIALRYSENGHVSIIEAGRPARGGMVFVYGTKQPKNNEKFLDVHRSWNAAGTGGDKRGKLLATRPYDDGQCYQVVANSDISAARRKKNPLSDPNADLLCQSDIQIPADAGTSGDYTLYWVWEWPLLNPTTGEVANPETYTQCADIKLVSTTNTGSGEFKSGQKIDNIVAVQEQLQNQFMLDPSAKPAMTTAPPFSMGPGAPSAAPVVSSPSRQSSTSPTPSQAKPSTSAASSPSATPVKNSSSATPTSSRPKERTSAPPKASSQPSQGFQTVTVTVTPDAKPALTVTETDYVIVKPSTTEFAKATITGLPPGLTPLPEADFLSRTSSASKKPVETPIGGVVRPVVEPFMPGASSAPAATKSGAVFHETRASFASSSTTSNAVVPIQTSTTSNAVVPIATAPANGTAPLLGRHFRRHASRPTRL